jgi:hypothetical protein
MKAAWIEPWPQSLPPATHWREAQSQIQADTPCWAAISRLVPGQGAPAQEQSAFRTPGLSTSRAPLKVAPGIVQGLGGPLLAARSLGPKPCDR